MIFNHLSMFNETNSTPRSLNIEHFTEREHIRTKKTQINMNVFSVEIRKFMRLCTWRIATHYVKQNTVRVRNAHSICMVLSWGWEGLHIRIIIWLGKNKYNEKDLLNFKRVKFSLKISSGFLGSHRYIEWFLVVKFLISSFH